MDSAGAAVQCSWLVTVRVGPRCEDEEIHPAHFTAVVMDRLYGMKCTGPRQAAAKTTSIGTATSLIMRRS